MTHKQFWDGVYKVELYIKWIGPIVIVGVLAFWIGERIGAW